MRIIRRLDELSVDELVTIRAALFRRLGVGTRGNIIEIAFGLAEHRGRVDHSRANAVCFYVRHKRQPRAKRDRIPESIDVRLKRGDHFVRVVLPSDVIHLGTRQVQMTGEPLVHRHSTGLATTGAVVAWQLGGQGPWTWGVVTVGHVLGRVKRLPETEPWVRIGNAVGTPVLGTLITRSAVPSRERVDAAIVVVERESLVRAKLIPAKLGLGGKRVRPLRQLKDDRGRIGFTFPQQNTIPLTVLRFLPISNLVPALGLLNFVIEAEAETGAFRGGRSGSLWAIAGQAAGMQHGGLPERFSRGWGQSLEFVFAWGAGQIAGIYGVTLGEVDFRLMRVI